MTKRGTQGGDYSTFKNYTLEAFFKFFHDFLILVYVTAKKSQKKNLQKLLISLLFLIRLNCCKNVMSRSLIVSHSNWVTFNFQKIVLVILVHLNTDDHALRQVSLIVLPTQSSANKRSLDLNLMRLTITTVQSRSKFLSSHVWKNLQKSLLIAVVLALLEKSLTKIFWFPYFVDIVIWIKNY